MHRCLLVQEIIYMICTHLQGFGRRQYYYQIAHEDLTEIQELRRTLAGLARTCQSFKDPALDVLWSDLDSLYPLLSCLSAGIIERPNGSFRLERALRPSDFVVFQRYARRVRYLGYGQRDPYMNKDLLRSLSSFPSTPSRPLLPNLAYLSWEGDSEELFPFIRFFVPSTLTSLHLPGLEWPHCKLTFISFLNDHCPKLKEFACSEPSREAISPISEYICQAQNLTKVNAGVPNAQAMEHLMASPDLRHLAISIPSENVWERFGGNFTSSLTTFELWSSRLDRTYEFMQLVKLRTTSANFVLDDVTPAPLVVGFFEQLGKSFDREALQILYYSIDGISQNPRANQYLYELEVHSLDPLLVFHNLAALELEDFRMPMMNDEIAMKLANALPRLKVLKLGTGQDWQTDTGLLRRSELTMYGVGYIIHHCPYLYTLGLVFDSTKPCEDLKPEWVNYNLRILDVGASPIDSPVWVASYFVPLAPRLKMIMCKRPLENLSPGIGQMPVPDKRRDNWELVLQMVIAFSGLKAAARERAMDSLMAQFREKMEKEINGLRQERLAVRRKLKEAQK